MLRAVRDSTDGWRAYLLFSIGEVFCVFLPVLVHACVLALVSSGAEEKSLFDEPDLLFAAIVLPALSAAKYLVAWVTTRRSGVRGVRVFGRLMIAGLMVVTSAILLGMFF